MDWRALALLYRHEIRMLLRARRTVLTSIILPAAIMPLMLWGTRYSQTQREVRLEQTTYRYAVAGAWAERIRGIVEQNRREAAFRDLKLEELPVVDPRRSLENNDLDFYIETLSGPEADAASTAEGRLRGVPAARVVYRGNREASRVGSERMVALLNAARRNESYALLNAHGRLLKPAELFSIDARSVATDAQVTGANVGRFITLFIVMLLLTGGSVAAIDIIAGEKERGTLETLLTSAAARSSIVTAKQMAICTVAFTITLIQALNFLIYVQLRLIELPGTFVLALSWTGVFALVALFIPLAAALAAALLVISAYARTYKEAQLHFFPMYLVCMAPALAAVLPGLSLRSVIAFVPIANVSVATREILMNRADPLMTLVTFLVMAATAVLMMRFSARLLVREDIVAPDNAETVEFLGGDELLRKRALRWFAVMWAVIFVLAGNFSWFQNFRVQVLFNQLVVFLGVSLLMIAVYKADWKRTLSLRPAPWQVWLAIPLAIPSGYIATVGLLNLANLVIPAPEELLRQFSSQAIPANTPMWQLYLLISVLPAVCEEIAFRGVLLHALRKRFSPLVLCVAAGLIFGLFHYSLFRIAPTAFLGIILSWIVVITGSILPGMLFHAGNNAFALWLGSNDFPVEAIQPLHYAAACTVFALCLWIVYRSRRAAG